MKLQSLASTRGTSYSRSFGRTAMLQQTPRQTTFLPLIDSPTASPITASPVSVSPTLPTIAQASPRSPVAFHLTSSLAACRRAGQTLDIFGASPYARGRVNVDKAIGIPKEAFP